MLSIQGCCLFIVVFKNHLVSIMKSREYNFEKGQGICWLRHPSTKKFLSIAISHQQVSSPQQFDLAPEAPGHLKLVRPLSEVFKQHFFPTESTNQVQNLQESIALQNLAAIEFKRVLTIYSKGFKLTPTIYKHITGVFQ